jgi:hypothetical protein
VSCCWQALEVTGDGKCRLESAFPDSYMHTELAGAGCTAKTKPHTGAPSRPPKKRGPGPQKQHGESQHHRPKQNQRLDLAAGDPPLRCPKQQLPHPLSAAAGGLRATC